MDEIDDELVALAQNFKGSEMTAIHLLKLASNAEKLFKSSKPAVKKPNFAFASFKLKN